MLQLTRKIQLHQVQSLTCLVESYFGYIHIWGRKLPCSGWLLLQIHWSRETGWYEIDQNHQSSKRTLWFPAHKNAQGVWELSLKLQFWTCVSKLPSDPSPRYEAITIPTQSVWIADSEPYSLPMAQELLPQSRDQEKNGESETQTEVKLCFARHQRVSLPQAWRLCESKTGTWIKRVEYSNSSSTPQ